MIAPGLAVILAFAPPAARAAAPNLLSYQGQLRESGAYVTGQRDVVISLCPSASGPLSSCLATARQTVAVAGGAFHCTYSLPSGVDLTTGAWWLDLQAGPPAGSLQEFSPREALSSSAYVLYASTASALAPAPGSGGAVISTAVAIGTAPPAALLDVQGSALIRGSFQLGVSSRTCDSAAAGSLQWTGASMQLCDGTAWSTLLRYSACAVYTCARSVVAANNGNCCCPAGTVMQVGSASNYFVSNFAAACTGSFQYGATPAGPALAGNGAAGWNATIPVGILSPLTATVDLVCCPQ